MNEFEGIIFPLALPQDSKNLIWISDWQVYLMVYIYWLMQTSADLPQDLSWLSNREIDLMNRFRFTKRQNDWLLGRWTAKRAFAYYSADFNSLDSYKEIEVISNLKGAPELFLSGRSMSVSISISHREEHSICMLVAEATCLGADLELIESRSEQFLQDYFTLKERESVYNAPEAYHKMLVCLLWSAKESALKASQEGLRVDTRSVEVYPIDFRSISGWQQLEVLDINRGISLKGWWKRKEDLLITTVCSLLSSPPIDLNAKYKD
ncbi:MAG: 4'-phosphopantetheinyl transferase superfamily protein [Acidobacteriota bacterium]